MENQETKIIEKIIVQPLCGVKLEIKYPKDSKNVARVLKYYGYGQTPEEAKSNLKQMKELADEEYIKSF